MGYYGTLWTYAGISSLACIFISIFLPETKGKTSPEIAAFFVKKNKIAQWINGSDDKGHHLE